MNRTEALELRQQRAKIANQMSDLASKGLATSEERVNFDKMDADQKELLARIERIENATGLAAEMQAGGKPPQGHPGGSDDDKIKEQRAKATRVAFATMLRHGDGPRSPLTAEQRELLAPVEDKELRALGVSQATGGQTWVPTGFVTDVERAMAVYGPMLEGGDRRPTILRTSTGAPLPYPTSNDTNNEGEQIDENPGSDTNAAEPTMGSVTLAAYMFSSKSVVVPIQLLQDSAFDIEAFLVASFAERLGRIINKRGTVGAGSTTLNGIVTAATLAGTCVGSAGNDGVGGFNTIGSDDLVTLEHSVDRAYRQTPAFMMHDTTVAFLKKLKDMQGRPLWLPGVSVGAPDTISGHPYAVNNDMDQLQTAATSPVVTRKTVLFGELKKYLMRLAGSMVVFRDESTYIRKAQIGFVAFMRADGNLLDAGTHPVKYMKNVG